MEHAVTLMEMLGAREAQGHAPAAAVGGVSSAGDFLLPEHCRAGKKLPGAPPGAFREGLERLACALLAGRLDVVHREEVDQPTGCEALWVVRGDGRAVKELCVELEDRDALGRLFDLDVLDPVSGKWDRTQLGQPPRKCLVWRQGGQGVRLPPPSIPWRRLQGPPRSSWRTTSAKKTSRPWVLWRPRRCSMRCAPPKARSGGPKE